MIKGFVGTYGSGKTLWLSRQAQWYFNRDLPVISNIPMWGYNKKREKVMAKFVTNDDIYDMLSGTLFQEKLTLLVIDEASGLFDSYKFKSIPSEIFDVLKQSRKIKLDIYYTSQRHKDVATRIRDNSEIIYLCQQYFQNTPFRAYTALGVQPFYFNDNAKSVEVKQYIIKRRVALHYFMKKYFKHYMTEFIVTSNENYKRFEEYLGNPYNITAEEISNFSKNFQEIRAPL